MLEYSETWSLKKRNDAKQCLLKTKPLMAQSWLFSVVPSVKMYLWFKNLGSGSVNPNLDQPIWSQMVKEKDEGLAYPITSTIQSKAESANLLNHGCTKQPADICNHLSLWYLRWDKTHDHRVVALADMALTWGTIQSDLAISPTINAHDMVH